MLTKFTKRQYRLALSKEVKRKLWLRLPYWLRLRIEHLSYVASVIVKHESNLVLTPLQRLSLPVYRKMSRWYPVIIRLNNPYNPFINAPVSDKDAEARINKFLSRFNA